MTDLSLPHVSTEFGFPRLWANLKRLWANLKNTLTVWRQRDRDRRYMAQMSAYERADMGVSHFVIEREVSKPFWRG